MPTFMDGERVITELDETIALLDKQKEAVSIYMEHHVSELASMSNDLVERWKLGQKLYNERKK